MDAPPAEQPGVDGPCARSDHRQNCAEDGLSNGNPRIAGMREIPRQGDPDLHDGCQHSRHWSPQTDQKEYPGGDPDDLQDDYRQRECFTQVGDPKMDERCGR